MHIPTVTTDKLELVEFQQALQAANTPNDSYDINKWLYAPNFYSEYRYIPWEEFTYGCYVRSYKGHLSLLIAPNALNFKEAKRIANRSSLLGSNRIFIDPVVEIFLGFSEVEEIKKFVEIHLAQVDKYDTH